MVDILNNYIFNYCINLKKKIKLKKEYSILSISNVNKIDIKNIVFIKIYSKFIKGIEIAVIA